MGRILAVDYGTKRVGLAVTDEEQLIATGLDTVASHELFAYLKKYLDENQVERMVVGLPKDLKGNPSGPAELIDNFILAFEKKYPQIPVERMDERFTSNLARQSLLDSGVKKKDRGIKEDIDRISATIILQSYLEFKK